MIFCYPYWLFPKDNIEYWGSQSVAKPICGKWSVKLRLDYRFFNHKNPLYLHYVDYELNHKTKTALNLSLNYRQVYQKTNGFHLEHRPHFNVTFFLHKNAIILKNRFRIEWCFPEAAETAWRYRNKAGVEFKKTILKHSCSPYFECEIFWDTQSKEINKSWFFAGFKISVLQQCQLNLFIMLQSIQRSVKWEWDYIFGTYFHYTI